MGLCSIGPRAQSHASAAEKPQTSQGRGAGAGAHLAEELGALVHALHPRRHHDLAERVPVQGPAPGVLSQPPTLLTLLFLFSTDVHMFDTSFPVFSKSEKIVVDSI